MARKDRERIIQDKVEEDEVLRKKRERGLDLQGLRTDMAGKLKYFGDPWEDTEFEESLKGVRGQNQDSPETVVAKAVGQGLGALEIAKRLLSLGRSRVEPEVYNELLAVTEKEVRYMIGNLGRE